MRSETSPLFDWLMVLCGAILVGMALYAMATGRLSITRSYAVSRDENPGAFWGWTAGFLAAGVAIVIFSWPGVGR